MDLGGDLLFVDDLTGLYNRRFLERSLVEQVSRARDDQTPLAVLLIDVDYFKDINDRCGHRMGDEILARVGRILHEEVGLSGYPIRYGGDEFVTLLPAVRADEAYDLGARLCDAVRALTLRHGGRPLRITLSIGLAHFPETVADPGALFECADAALYMAKRQGRDRIEEYVAGQADNPTQILTHRFPCPTLVGREAALADIVDCLQAPLPGGVQWILVGGDAGVGKTRLLKELRERAIRHGQLVLESTGTVGGALRPCGLLLDALAGALRERPAVGQAMAEALSPTQLRSMVTLLPELARYALLSTPSAGEAAEGPAGQSALLVRMIRSLCESERVVWLGDDVHLADPWTLRVLERLDEEATRLVVCLALRDDADSFASNPDLAGFLGWAQRRANAAYVRLAPLGREDVAMMIDAILEASDPGRLVDLIHMRSRGVPLLVEELLKYMLHRRLLEEGVVDPGQLPSETELLAEVRAAKSVPPRSATAVKRRDADGLLRGGVLLHGRYAVERALARGGMSVVYRATIPDLGGRPVAVKEMLLASMAAETRQRAAEQFQREAQMLATLDHPNLVEVIDFFEDDDARYLVMSFVEGVTLAQRAAQGVDVAQVTGWLVTLCDVLGYLHAQQPPVLFRDLKPANVMLDRHGRLRLIDFGIAHALDDEQGTSTYIRGAGTPGYAPIEQCGGGSTDCRSDVYALGATAYALLAGEVPPPSVARVSRTAPLTPLRERNPNVPVALERLIHEMLAVHAVDRPQSVEEVRARLQERGPALQTILTSGLCLRIHGGEDAGQRFALGAREVWIGRADEGQQPTPGHLALRERSVSRRQAMLVWDASMRRYVLHHEPGATNPTLVNGAAVTEKALGLGDVIRAGHFEAVLEMEMAVRSEPETTVSVRVPGGGGAVQDTTGDWDPRVGFMLRVISGNERDLGAVYPVAESALVEGREFVVAGPSYAGPHDFRLAEPTLGDGYIRFAWKQGGLLMLPPLQPPARVNGRALGGARRLAPQDCVQWGRLVLLYTESEGGQTSHYVLERLSLPGRTPVAMHPLPPEGRVVIGRQEDAAVRMEESGVSRMHAALERKDEGWWLHHLSQTNPTLVNGSRLRAPRMLAHGDEIQVSAGSVLRFADCSREI